MRHSAAMPAAIVGARRPVLRCRSRTHRCQSHRAKAGRACPGAACNPDVGRPRNGAGSFQAPDVRPVEKGQVLIVYKRMSCRKGSSGAPASMLSPPMSPPLSRGVSASSMRGPRLRMEQWSACGPLCARSPVTARGAPGAYNATCAAFSSPWTATFSSSSWRPRGGGGSSRAA